MPPRQKQTPNPTLLSFNNLLALQRKWRLQQKSWQRPWLRTQLLKQMLQCAKPSQPTLQPAS